MPWVRAMEDHHDNTRNANDAQVRDANAPLAVRRARKIQRFLSQPFHVAEAFTGKSGSYVVFDVDQGLKIIKHQHCQD